MERVLKAWRTVLAAGIAGMVSVMTHAQGSRRDLSVSVTAPQSATVGSAAAFDVGIGGSDGAAGVTVTAVYLPKVTLDSSVPAGLCTANTASAELSTTVLCSATGLSSLVIRVIPQSAGTLTAVVGVIGSDYDPFMGNNKASAIVTVTSGGTPTPLPTSTRTNTPAPTTTPGGPTATPTPTVTRTPTSSPTPSGPTPTPGSAWTLFGARTPTANNQEGSREVGELFRSSQSGTIVALRFWRSPSEPQSGPHVVRLWDTGRGLRASVSISDSGGSGWQEQSLDQAVTVSAGDYYWVSYTVSSWASETPDALGGCLFGIGSIVNGPLTTYCGGTAGPSQFPGASLNGTNYFADIRFQPGAAPSPTPTSTPTATPTITRTRTPSITPTASLTPTPTPTPSRTTTPSITPTATPNTSGTAVYNGVLGAPACGGIGTFCDSGTLLNGRDSVQPGPGAGGGPEPNQPNTLFGSPCPDGGSGTYHVDESIDAIRVSAQGPAGTTLAEGVTVSVDVTVWAAANAQDYLDLYSASDATAPTWTFLGSVAASQNSNAQHLFWSYVLPSGGLQALRAHLRRGGSAASCTPGSPGSPNFNDHDDLVFAAGAHPTSTPTGTPTATPSQTASATPTSTPTKTPTSTPTPTQPPPTGTPTVTPSRTASATPTSTPTKTPTSTPTPTQPPPTGTPSQTASATPTSTPAKIPTSTPTPTQPPPTSTPTATLTKTPIPGSPTSTPTPTPALTPAAITLVQKKTAGAQGVTAVAATFSLRPAAGNLLVAVVGVKGKDTINLPTDQNGASNGWLTAINQTGTSGPTRPGQAIFYKIAGASETLTVKETLTGSKTTMAIQLFEYTGIAAGGTLDGTASANGTGSDPASTGTVTAGAADDLLLAAITTDGVDNVTAASNGFTLEQNFVVGSSGGRETFGSADRKTSASNNSTTFTHGSAAWRAQIAAFRHQ